MTRRLSILLVFLLPLLIFGVGVSRIGEGAADTATRLSSGGTTFEAEVIQPGRGERVAMVPVYGEIVTGSSDATGQFTGGDDTVALLRAIRESGRYEGVILEVDTPGGGVLPSAEIAEEVSRVREADIKVVAWMRDVAASGGYYVAADADRIVAAPSTITGSIGVIVQTFNVTELADKVGVEAVTVTSGPLKDMLNPFRDVTEREREVLQQLVDEAYADFVAVVAQGRDMSRSRVREIADGRIYTGRQAKRLGLVDELGLRDEAYDEMAKLVDEGDGDDLRVVRFTRQLSLLEQLGATSGVGGLSARELAGLSAQALAAIARGEGVRAAPATGPRAAVPPGLAVAGGQRVVQVQYLASVS